ncbi:MAG: TlpA family protein disulfide reductase [Polyangiaceae bacterium]|nr:TlpA family protein disulfide reductase [Polyangiaceae bacterium]
MAAPLPQTAPPPASGAIWRYGIPAVIVLLLLVALPKFALQRHPMVGKPAPDFSLDVIHNGDPGSKLQLTKLQGKPVLLAFWATWCGVCRAEIPTLNKVAERYKDRGLVVVGVDTAEKPGLGGPFARRLGMVYPVVYDDNNVDDLYGVQALPTLVVVGRDGQVQSVRVGLVDESMLDALVSTALLEAARSAPPASHPLQPGSQRPPCIALASTGLEANPDLDLVVGRLAARAGRHLVTRATGGECGEHRPHDLWANPARPIAQPFAPVVVAFVAIGERRLELDAECKGLALAVRLHGPRVVLPARSRGPIDQTCALFESHAAPAGLLKPPPPPACSSRRARRLARAAASAMPASTRRDALCGCQRAADFAFLRTIDAS